MPVAAAMLIAVIAVGRSDLVTASAGTRSQAAHCTAQVWVQALPAMTNPATAAPRAKAVVAVAAVVLGLLALGYVLEIDVWYVVSGGVPWVFAAETALVGFLLGWFFGSRTH